ncbi:hypothetical protein CAPN008_20470 [Capnocytophaga canis]|uniref:hypothetical protein n=1 Tax=Capnocytophaga canis TaxID=1848903 RepID=UPI001AD10748|nr:hypothetical protein [Capnocytophaga canis]GIM61997.1 hypothetical protein CAPN008_20470 [Capnocytophaga canis]
MKTIVISLAYAIQVNEIFMDGRWNSFGIEQETSTTYKGLEDEMDDFISVLEQANIEIIFC